MEIVAHVFFQGFSQISLNSVDIFYTCGIARLFLGNPALNIAMLCEADSRLAKLLRISDIIFIGGAGIQERIIGMSVI